MKRISPLLAALLLAALAFPAQAQPRAQRVAGVRFPATTQAGDRQLQLNGTALYEVTFLNVDVWCGGLYLEAPTQNPAEVLAEERAKQVKLHYLRDASASRVQSGWGDYLRDLPGASQWNAQIDRFTAMLPDISEGDTITITYVPDAPLTIMHNRRRLGRIPSAGFARFLFSSWVGPAADDDVREGLLGR